MFHATRMHKDFTIASWFFLFHKTVNTIMSTILKPWIIKEMLS